jgi:hypothetical protein
MTDADAVPLWKSLLLIFAFGGLGGFLGWLHAVTFTESARSPVTISLATSVLLGMGAAWIGVYLLASPKNIRHALAIALACGIAWDPVYHAVEAYTSTLADDRKAEEDVRELKELSEKVKGSPKDVTPYDVSRLGKLTGQMVGREEEVRNTALRAEMGETIGESLLVMEGAMEFAPQEAARALAEVGIAAARVGHPETALLAARPLRTFPEDGKFDAPAAREASDSLYRMAEAARAQRHQEEALRLREMSHDVYRLSAEELERRGDPEGARELQERALIGHEPWMEEPRPVRRPSREPAQPERRMR